MGKRHASAQGYSQEIASDYQSQKHPDQVIGSVLGGVKHADRRQNHQQKADRVGLKLMRFQPAQNIILYSRHRKSGYFHSKSQ
jgi:hypothetical protein